MLKDSKILRSNKINNSTKVSQAPRTGAVELNGIVVTPLIPDVMFALGTEIYDIESLNTREARIQATTTTTTTLGVTQTNVFAVQKIAEESLIETVIPAGELLLATVDPNSQTRQIDPDRLLVAITLKKQG